MSSTLGINELSNRLIRSGRQVFKLGLGQSPFPVPIGVQEELRANAHQRDYLPVMGLRELRAAVSRFIARTQAVQYQPENIMIGPGSKELMFILQLVYYGDLVIPTPSWVSYAPQALIIGRQIRWLDTAMENGWRVTPDRLEALCREDYNRPRLMILNYPANPHGCTYTPDELKTLAKIARKYRMVVLSDEIYGELHHEGKHISIARFYPEGTIISTGMSKWCGAGGWRLGAFLFPRNLSWLRDAMATVASETYTSTAAPIQYAAVRAFQGGLDIELYLFQARRILKALGQTLTMLLKESGVEVLAPAGAFYLFPDFAPFRERLNARGIKTSKALCERLLEETGVAILPGSDFGRPAQELTVRLAYVDFDGARAMAAAERIPMDRPLDDEFVAFYGHHCVVAIDRLCEWLQK